MFNTNIFNMSFEDAAAAMRAESDARRDAMFADHQKATAAMRADFDKQVEEKFSTKPADMLDKGFEARYAATNLAIAATALEIAGGNLADIIRAARRV